MKFVAIMLILVIAISSSGCTGNTATKKVNSDISINSASSTVSATATVTPTETSISEPSASSSNVSTIQEVIIKASYEKPLSLEDKNTIILDGLLKGEEYIEVIVTGQIFNFEQIALVWDENKSELIEKETVKSIEKIENQTVVIKTYQAEGIPTEKIKWKSKTGKIYEYIINEKSLDDTDNSTTKFDMK